MRAFYYFSPTGDGWENLAADEYFLDHLTPEDFLLYFYVNRKAVIIGRNQNPWRECNTAAMDRDGVQLVRRCTGGGAVYHDSGNLNFSFITGKAYYDVDRQSRLLLDGLRALGIPAERNGRNDLTVLDRKFSGHAFCQRGEMCQHHGTLLLNTELGAMQNYLTVSPEKLRAKGVSSVRARVCNLTELVPELTVDSVAAALRRACEAVTGPLTPLTLTEETREKIAPYLAKQRSWEWRMGKSPVFDFSAGKRFSWGEAQLCMNVSGGIVTEAALYTDALDPELPETLKALLLGRRYDTLRQVLSSAPLPLRDLAELL